jgi:quercetin dioxygenase-like cupin family protein
MNSSSQIGHVFENPLNDERVTVLVGPREHPDKVLVADVAIEPGSEVDAHIHPDARERFVVMEGRIGFAVDGDEIVLGPGGRAEVPAGAVHRWWVDGDESARMLVEVTPGERFAEFAGTLFGLIRRDGAMPGLLQMAVIVNAYRDTAAMAGPPQFIQRPMLAVLAAIGRLRGLKAYYPEFEEPVEVVEPAADALALVGHDGYLRWAGDREKALLRTA